MGKDNRNLYLSQGDKINAKLGSDATIAALEKLYITFKKAMDKSNSELWWQRFIGKNFDVVLQGYKRILPKTNVSVVQLNLPDFSLITHNSELEVLEIKKPSTPLLSRTGKNYYLSNDIVMGTSQLENYIREVSKNADAICRHFFKEHNIYLNAVSQRGIILAGDTRNFSLQEKERFSLLSSGYKNISVMTYDQLLITLRYYIDALKKLSLP